MYMNNNETLEFVMETQKNIALIAHDNKKQDLIDWCTENREILEHHFLCGTGTTAKMVAERTGLPVRGFNSGPLGGDQQIGARIVDGKIDIVIFFSDPLTAQPHEPDVSALLRLCDVQKIPLATNASSAIIMLEALKTVSTLSKLGKKRTGTLKVPVFLLNYYFLSCSIRILIASIATRIAASVSTLCVSSVSSPASNLS